MDVLRDDSERPSFFQIDYVKNEQRTQAYCDLCQQFCFMYFVLIRNQLTVSACEIASRCCNNENNVQLCIYAFLTYSVLAACVGNRSQKRAK